jgi:predicted ATPase
MEIKIELLEDSGLVIAKRSCEDSFEIAEQNLESLRKYWNAKMAREEELTRGKPE